VPDLPDPPGWSAGLKGNDIGTTVEFLEQPPSWNIRQAPRVTAKPGKILELRRITGILKNIQMFLDVPLWGDLTWILGARS
jgi:hypothetical protein